MNMLLWTCSAIYTAGHSTSVYGAVYPFTAPYSQLDTSPHPSVVFTCCTRRYIRAIWVVESTYRRLVHRLGVRSSLLRWEAGPCSSKILKGVQMYSSNQLWAISYNTAVELKSGGGTSAWHEYTVIDFIDYYEYYDMSLPEWWDYDCQFVDDTNIACLKIRRGDVRVALEHIQATQHRKSASKIELLSQMSNSKNNCKMVLQIVVVLSGADYFIWWRRAGDYDEHATP